MVLLKQLEFHSGFLYIFNMAEKNGVFVCHVHNHIRMSLLAGNHMIIESLIHNQIVTNSFSFYKKHIFDFQN